MSPLYQKWCRKNKSGIRLLKPVSRHNVISWNRLLDAGLRCPVPAVAAGWAGSLRSGRLVGWGHDRTHGVNGRKGWRSPKFTFSLCCRSALRELLDLPICGLGCVLALKATPSRGHLWLMGNTVILCSLIWTSRSPAGNRVMSPSLSFGNRYFTNMKYTGICTCTRHPRSLPAACTHLYFQVSTVLPMSWSSILGQIHFT